MKKVIIMIAFVTFGVTNSNAQTTTTIDNRETLSFGLKAGANYSNIYDSENQDFIADAKFGFVAGAFVSIPLGGVSEFSQRFCFRKKGSSLQEII